MVIKYGKVGKFLACPNNPECEFMSWDKPTGEKCPKCNSYIIEKGTKKKRICCSKQECGYVLSTEENL